MSEKQQDQELGLSLHETETGIPQRKAKKGRIFACFIVLYTIWCAYGSVIPFRAKRGSPAHCGHASQGYLNRLVGGSFTAQKGHKHTHDKPKWISPEKAEEIYLAVPSNDSIRE